MDAYTFRARLQPALVAALPIALAVVAFYPDGITVWTPIWALFSGAGGAFLLAEVGRQGGKKKEAKLWESWGGAPTTQHLRHRDAQNRLTLARLHEKLHQLRPDLKFPSPEEETANPGAADRVYEAAAQYLRDSTRDRTKHHLVFEALCEYGFRRNLWGLKPVGLLLSLVALLATAGASWLYVQGSAAPPAAPLLAATTLSAAFVPLWIFRVNPDWVRSTATAYAERLLGSVESLG